MYIPVVGLEIHLQVKSNSKMFCRCKSEYFGSEPNINVCPVCFGLPGALPVPNEVAFNKALKLAIALNCEINKVTKFDRKNYFYPDLPKGYQISQFDKPIGENGYVEIEVDGDSRRVRLQRIHLEEDTAKSMHLESGETLIDYNKSGVALIEIVTYPDFESTKEVIAFAKRLKQIVRYLDISDAEMQKGHMRFELNISVKKDSDTSKELPNFKIEVKNIGSISVLEKVLNFEVKRQGDLLDRGEVIKNQTRGLKGMSGETVFQRFKEESSDYRYFPEPDIPPINIAEELINDLKSNLVELPHQRKQRYLNLGLNEEQSDIFVEDVNRGNWFDNALNILESSSSLGSSKDLIKDLAKWIVGDISSILEKKGLNISDIKLDVSDFLQALILLRSNKITGSILKSLLLEVIENGESIVSLIKERDLIQVDNASDLSEYIDKAIKDNDKVVKDISKNPNAIKFLVGYVMKLSRGKSNPRVVEEELRKKLDVK